MDPPPKKQKAEEPEKKAPTGDELEWESLSWTQFEDWAGDPKSDPNQFAKFKDDTGKTQVVAIYAEDRPFVAQGTAILYYPKPLPQDKIIFAKIERGDDAAPPNDAVDVSQQLVFTFMDVGQGNGTLVQCPGGEIILIDCGSVTTKADELLVPSLTDYMANVIKSKVIDYLIVSHADKDHINLLSKLTETYTIKNFFCGGRESHYNKAPGVEFNAYVKKVSGKGVASYLVNGGDPYSEAPDTSDGKRLIQTTAGLKVFIIAANAPVTDSSSVKNLFDKPELEKITGGTKANAASIVLCFQFGGKQVIIAGDDTYSTDDYIFTTKWTGHLESYALEGGHHGAETSYSEKWLKAVNPSWIHFSADNRSQFLHARYEVFQRVVQCCPKVLECADYGPHGFVLGMSKRKQIESKELEKIGSLDKAMEELAGIKQSLTKKFSPAIKITWRHVMLEVLRDFIEHGLGRSAFSWLDDLVLTDGETLSKKLMNAPKLTQEQYLELADSKDFQLIPYWADRLEFLDQEINRLLASKDEFEEEPWEWVITQCNFFTLLDTINMGVYWTLTITAEGETITERR